MSSLELVKRMGIWTLNNTKKTPRDWQRKLEAKKKTNGRGDIWKEWEKMLYSLNTGTEYPRLLELSVNILYLCNPWQIPRCKENCPQPFSMAWQTASHGCFCLSVCHLPEDRKPVQTPDLAYQCSACCPPVQDLYVSSRADPGGDKQP